MQNREFQKIVNKDKNSFWYKKDFLYKCCYNFYGKDMKFAYFSRFMIIFILTEIVVLFLLAIIGGLILK